jgi:RNA polymerase sigma-70 factor (ECF subfamily)
MTRTSNPLSREETPTSSVVSMEEARFRRRADVLLREHGDYLHGLARRLCRNHFDPDDLVQDVLEKTVRAPDAIPAGANERAWLSRVMHNLFIDRLRRKQARREDPINVDVPAVPKDEHAWWESLTVGDIRAKLAQLSEEQRATFELFAFEGKSYDEIASQLGIAKATVGTRILRARTRLRELLTKERLDG